MKMSEQIKKQFVEATRITFEEMIKSELNKEKEKFVKDILEEIGESINFQKDLLEKMPESQFHIGRIQGLSTAEDIIKTKSGFKE